MHLALKDTPSELITVQSCDIDSVWSMVEEYIAAACSYSHGRFTPESYKESLKSANMQLWMVVDGEGASAVAGTSIVDYPESKACRVEFCGGRDMRAWVDYIDVIERWAKSLGCNLIEMCGRAGWERIFKEYDKTSFIQKELA